MSSIIACVVPRVSHAVAVTFAVALAVLTLAFSASGATPTPPPLRVGLTAVTTAKTNVRSMPDGTLVGTQPRYALGTITVGPTFSSADSAWWVKFSFNSGPSGWVGADMLINGIPTPTSVVVATGSNQNMILDENGNIEVAYTSSVDSNNNATYFFTESTNQGLSFSTPAVVPMKTIVQPFVPPPQIAAERNGAIDIVYVCPPSQCAFPDSIPGHVLPSIAMIRSTNHGATWSAPIEISVPPVPDRFGASAPVIAACGAGVTVAWIDDGISSQGNVDTFPDLYVVNVVNGVRGAPINVTDDITNEQTPQILVNPQGSVYLSWTGQNAAQAINQVFTNQVFFTSIPNCAAVQQ